MIMTRLTDRAVAGVVIDQRRNATEPINIDELRTDVHQLAETAHFNQQLQQAVDGWLRIQLRTQRASRTSGSPEPWAKRTSAP